MKLTIKNEIVTATLNSMLCCYIISLIRHIQIYRTSLHQTKISEVHFKMAFKYYRLHFKGLGWKRQFWYENKYTPLNSYYFNPNAALIDFCLIFYKKGNQWWVWYLDLFEHNIENCCMHLKFWSLFMMRHATLR